MQNSKCLILTFFVTLFFSACKKDGETESAPKSTEVPAAPVEEPKAVPLDDQDVEASIPRGDEKEVESSEPEGSVKADGQSKLENPKLDSLDLAFEVSDFSLLPEKAQHEAGESPVVSISSSKSGLSLLEPTIVLDKLGRDGNRYVLMSNGDLFRYIASRNQLKCQITTLVQDFKVSMHINDAALIYFIRRESSVDNLYVLNQNVNPPATGCPTTASTKIMSSIRIIGGKFKYTVVSNTSATIVTDVVNMALSNNNSGSIDQLRAWGNVSSVYSQTGIKDYLMNECWGTANRTYNTFVAFAVSNTNRIWKIPGVNPGTATTQDPISFATIQEFKAHYKVCETPVVPPPTLVTTEYFASDTCTGTALGMVNFTASKPANETACQTFSTTTTRSIWGAKINGVCYNIADTTALNACKRTQVDPRASNTVQIFDRSDSCSGTLLSVLEYPALPADHAAFCTNVAGTSTESVWSFKAANGSCVDVKDTTYTKACARFRFAAVLPVTGQTATNFYFSDSCSSNFLARVVLGTDQTLNAKICSDMTAVMDGNIWGTKVDGAQCVNVVDGPLSNFCKGTVVPPTTTVNLSDVQIAIARHKTTWATYNADTAGVAACKTAGASAGWSPVMQDYYCTFPGVAPEIRSCFTFSVRGTPPYTLRTYPDAYNYCATQHTGTPMKWVKDNEDAVFIAVMIDKKFGTPPAVVLADVQTAIARHKTTWATYNADTAGVAACKSAGASAGWTATMQDYYCTFPGVSPEIRSCFTFSVRGTAPYTLRSYPDAYNYCAIQHTGTPMKWVMDNEDAVFKAVMIDKKF